MARPVDKPWPPPRDMHHPRPLVRGARGTLCADRTTVQALGQRGGCLQGRPKEPFLRWLRIFPRGQGLVSPDVDNPVLCFIGCAVLWGPIVIQLFACAVLVSEEITEPVCLPLLRPVPVGWEPQRRETGLPMGCPTSVLHTSPTQGSKPGSHRPPGDCGRGAEGRGTHFLDSAGEEETSRGKDPNAPEATAAPVLPDQLPRRASEARPALFPKGQSPACATATRECWLPVPAWRDVRSVIGHHFSACGSQVHQNTEECGHPARVKAVSRQSGALLGPQLFPPQVSAPAVGEAGDVPGPPGSTHSDISPAHSGGGGCLSTQHISQWFRIINENLIQRQFRTWPSVTWRP